MGDKENGICKTSTNFNRVCMLVVHPNAFGECPRLTLFLLCSFKRGRVKRRAIWTNENVPRSRFPLCFSFNVTRFVPLDIY